MDKNRKLKWDKAIKGRKITTTYGENYTAGDDTKGLFQQADDNSWTPVSVEQARDIYVPNVTDPVSNSYTQLGPMPTLTVTSPDWETVPYNVEDTRFGGRTPITTINVRRNKNTGKILPEDYRQALAIKDWYAKQHPKSDPSENVLNDAVFTALTLGANKNLETTTKGISSLVSKVDPVVKSAVKNYIAKPLIAGSIWDNAQLLAFGLSGTEYFTNYLVNKGWSPIAASIVGASTNPVYLINFGGGLVSSKLSNSAKTLLGIESKNELGNYLWSPTYEPIPLQTALRNYIDKKHPLGIYATVPQKEGKILVDFNGNKINFDPTEPITNSEFYYPIKLPFVGKFYKEFSLTDGPALLSKGNYPDYEILTTTPREAILNEYVNPYYNQSKFRLGKLNFPLSKQGLSNNHVDYSPQYKLLWENFVRKNYPIDQQSDMERLFSLLNADKIPLSPTLLTAKADEIAQGAYSRTVRPRLVKLLGENNVPKDVIFDLPNILPFYPQLMDDLNSMIDGAAFKPLNSIDLRKKAFNERKNKNFLLNFPIDEAGSHFALSGNNTVNPFMMSVENPTVSRFLDLLTDTSIHEMAGHGTESLLPAIEYYKYSIPAKKSYFNYDFKKLQNDKKYQYIFDPSELRARIIVAKDMLALNGSELNSTNLKNALTVIEPKYDKALSKTGWEWMFRRAINGYTLAPFVIPVGAKFVNTDSPEYRKNGGKLISRKYYK